VNKPLVPPGFGRQSVEESKDNSVPPGFEVIQPGEPSPNQKAKE